MKIWPFECADFCEVFVRLPALLDTHEADARRAAELKDELQSFAGAVGRERIVLRTVRETFRYVGDFALTDDDAVAMTHGSDNRKSDLIEIVAMPRHQKIALLPSENEHEVFGRSVGAFKQVLKRDIAGRVVHLPIALVKRNDFHKASAYFESKITDGGAPI